MKTDEQIGHEAAEAARREIDQALDDEGLTASKLVTYLKKELSASYGKKPAWSIRQRARQDAHKLRGDYASEKMDLTSDGKPIAVNIVKFTQDEDDSDNNPAK